MIEMRLAALETCWSVCCSECTKNQMSDFGRAYSICTHLIGLSRTFGVCVAVYERCRILGVHAFFFRVVAYWHRWSDDFWMSLAIDC
jgi:hypothetical protein